MSIAYVEKAPFAPRAPQGARMRAIGDVARDLGVSLRTLRFYEDRGLVRPRRTGSSRLYSPQDIARLRDVLRVAGLGFTLREIRDMKQGADGRIAIPPSMREEHLGILLAKKADLESKISALRG